MSHRPKTGAELSPGHKLRGVLHRLVAGAARKPEAIVRLPDEEEDLRETHPEMLEEASKPATNNRPTVAKMHRVTINATASRWLEVVTKIAGQERIKVDDLWVLLHCSGHGEPVFFSTRLRDDILAFSNQEHGDGRLHVFVRMKDLIKAVVDEGAPQLAINATEISYAAGGMRYDMPFSERMENEIVQPVPPPDDGYEELRGMGSALTEAARFAKPERDHLGLHAIQVVPLKDGTGNVEIIALSAAMGYRRVSHQPKLTETLTIVPNWLIKQPRLVGASLGMRMAGFDFVWLCTSKGMIAGFHMPDLPYPANYREKFRALDGRVEFTVDEVRALRRAILEVGRIQATEREIGISSNGSQITVRGQSSGTVTCAGDQMSEILVDPDLLTEALKVRGVVALEFKREDPEHNIRLVGRDFAISVMPCFQRQA